MSDNPSLFLTRKTSMDRECIGTAEASFSHFEGRPMVDVLYRTDAGEVEMEIDLINAAFVWEDYQEPPTKEYAETVARGLEYLAALYREQATKA